MDKKLVKQDISFLEYPLWFQDKYTAEQSELGCIWQDREGFLYRAGYKPPVQIDRLFLLYLTLKSQNEGWKEVIELSRFEILNACRVGIGSREYQRLEDSLKRWKMIGIEFQGTFYNGIEYSAMNFGVIDDWEIEKKTKKLKVRFSPRWLDQQKNSKFFKYINFNEIITLRSPLALRLYEILIKTFHGRSVWEIGSLKLAQKIPMKEAHPAHIIPKIKAAVNRINERTDLQIALEVRRPKRGKAIFEFRKLSTEEKDAKKVEKPKVLDVPKEKQGELEELLLLVPEKERSKKTVLEMISKALRKHDEAYVRINILYSNEKATKNYRAYLSKALKENWGGQVEEEAKKKAQEQEELTREGPSVGREPDEEEVEAKFQERLGEMKEAEVEVRMKQARIEVAKELKSHPEKVPHKAAQAKLFEIIKEELRGILSGSIVE